MNLIRKYNGLFAVNESGRFIGKIVNEATGNCCDNPNQDNPGVFDRLFRAHGYIYHRSDNSPNPFFKSDWSEVFSNPEMLPTATRNVFVDQSKDAENDFYAVEITETSNYKFVTGAFEGSIAKEGTQILDVPFSQLDQDLQLRIREYGENFYPDLDKQTDFPISMDDIKERYENSWDSEETSEEVDIKPVSEW